jgi:hypothetical protein
VGTELKFFTTNHAETDGQTERVNAIVNKLLRRYVLIEHICLVEYLPIVEFAYNCSYQRSIQCTPFMADLTREADIPNGYPCGYLEDTSESAQDLAAKLKALFTRNQDYIAELPFQARTPCQ